MYSNVTTATLSGIDSVLVSVEADISDGMPIFNMVGLLATDVKESKERVRTALRNVGFSLPIKRITVNISPASIRKNGTGFDLPIAVAILAAIGVIENEKLNNIAMLGELSLNGELQGINGVLPMILSAKEANLNRVILPMANLEEAKMVPDMELIPVHNLTEVIEFFSFGILPEIDIDSDIEKQIEKSTSELIDFSYVNGQKLLRRGCEVAASGMHNMLMIGPPGSGKTMVAKAVPTILPPMNELEKMEVSKIYSVCGLFHERKSLIENRPFRSPHHTISAPGLTGGGAIPHPGEISLAHRGVLFLDELPEFQKSTLEILRQPMEDKEVHIVRAGGAVTYPADFMLIAAMNPCSCGYYPNLSKCRCTERQVNAYMSRISQPLLDRIDITVEAPQMTFDDLTVTGMNESSEAIRYRVLKCHDIQKQRFKNSNIFYNSQIPSSLIDEYCHLGEKEEKYASSMFKKLDMTARTYHKMLKVARTIADLDGSKEIRIQHLNEAVCYRSLEKKFFEGGN